MIPFSVTGEPPLKPEQEEFLREPEWPSPLGPEGLPSEDGVDPEGLGF